MSHICIYDRKCDGFRTKKSYLVVENLVKNLKKIFQIFKFFERSGGGNCEAISDSQFPTERREMIFCAIPLTENLPFFCI
jgi:hypothetical protein